MIGSNRLPQEAAHAASFESERLPEDRILAERSSREQDTINEYNYKVRWPRINDFAEGPTACISMVFRLYLLPMTIYNDLDELITRRANFLIGCPTDKGLDSLSFER